MARTDVQNLQAIIYQVQYQKALRDQISAFLDVLHRGNFELISQYLTECYENGWIGTLYDLQGQGVPLLFRINQEQVIAAVETNSKLSKKLYDALGIDIKALKKSEMITCNNRATLNVTDIFFTHNGNIKFLF